ncbi:MAG: hypothetical protein U0996_19600 [Planctomycetaceae bacterium]
MERLKLLIALVATACLAQSSFAQSAAPLVSTVEQGSGSKAVQASGSFSVIGDVEQPNSYSFQQSLTIFEAVRKARPLSAEVNVTVVRSAQTRSQWTLLLNMNSTDTGERLVAGDVLIVRSLETVAVPQKNAAVQSPSGTQVVALADDQVVIGDVLTGLGLSTSSHALSVPARMPGQAPLRTATLSDRVQHGDVVCLGTVGTQQTRDFGSVRHTFSEWKGADAAVPSVPAPALPVIPEPSAGMILPESHAQAEPVSVQNTAPRSDATAVVNSADSGSTAATAATLTIPVEADPFDVKTAPVALADPFAVEEDENSTLEVKPVSQQVASTMNPQSPVDVAPVPPVEDLIQPQVPVNAEMSLLNIVVIGGLLVAGILVLAGSLRVDDEIPASAMQQSLMDSATASIPQIATPVMESPKQTTAATISDELEMSAERLLASKVKVPAAPVMIAAAAPVVPVAAPGLVKEGEWFSRDWAPRSSVEKEGIAADIAQVSLAFLVEKTVDEAIQAQIVAEPVKIAEPVKVPPAIVQQAPMMESMAVPIVASPAETLQEKMVSDDLDDLIQNRLPVDLKEVQLPLRINLFGRPAGPRRLRIDAAHTSIRAPHMVSSADRRRNDSISSRMSVGASETAEEDLQFGTQNTRKERIDS